MSNTQDNTRDESLVWTIPNSQGDIEIYIPGTRKIVFKISGGADSAILLYILAKYKNDYNPNISFALASSVNENLPYQEIFAKQVIEFVNSRYSLGDYEHHVNNNRGGEFYTVDQDALTFPLRQTPYGDPIKDVVQWMGITCNPPVEAMQAHDMYTDDRVFDRDKGHENNYPIKEIEIEPGVYSFNRPFMQHDKQGVAELYTTFGVLDELFPLTRSCEDATTDFSHHCGKCWFCLERKWGYGVLDPHLEKDEQ